MEKDPRTSESVPSSERGEGFKIEDVAVVTTAKGSSYRYLEDGTTQRFKTVEGKEYTPQSALVYVPDYEWVKQHATPEILEKLGENEAIYTEVLLEYVQNPRKEAKKVYIVDKDGNKLETNQQIKDTTGPVYLAFLTNGVVDFFIPISRKPKLGFMTFDTRKYVDEKSGETMRERHLGNKVADITLRDKN